MPFPPAPAPYPPVQQPILDPRTGRVTRAWHLFFLSLVSSTDLGGLAGALPPGSVPIATLGVLDSPRLLGRGSPGTGPVEPILVGMGLALTGTTLSATGGDPSAAGYWTPITNGNPLSPEILFDTEGDCVVGFVPTP